MDKRFGYYPYLAQIATFGSGIKPSVLLSQWAYETGYGTSNIWRKQKNPAGIKCHGSDNCFNGFRSYPNALSGFFGYVRFLCDNKRYSEVFKLNTSEEQLKQIERAHWAGESNTYANNCISIINDNNLRKFDSPVWIYVVILILLFYLFKRR